MLALQDLGDYSPITLFIVTKLLIFFYIRLNSAGSKYKMLYRMGGIRYLSIWGM